MECTVVCLHWHFSCILKAFNSQNILCHSLGLNEKMISIWRYHSDMLWISCRGMFAEMQSISLCDEIHSRSATTLDIEVSGNKILFLSFPIQRYEISMSFWFGFSPNIAVLALSSDIFIHWPLERNNGWMFRNNVLQTYNYWISITTKLFCQISNISVLTLVFRLTLFIPSFDTMITLVLYLYHSA